MSKQTTKTTDPEVPEVADSVVAGKLQMANKVRHELLSALGEQLVALVEQQTTAKEAGVFLRKVAINVGGADTNAKSFQVARTLMRQEIARINSSLGTMLNEV